MPSSNKSARQFFSAIRSGAQWIDVPNPTKNDLDWLAKKFRIHPVIVEELKGPSARSRVEAYGRYLYFIFYLPIYDTKEETSRRTEIDFIITKNHVVTVHYDDLEALSYLKDKADENSFKLLYKIVEALFDFQERQLRHVRDKTEEIGNMLFKDDEKGVLQKVSRLKRDISEYRIVVRHQGPILQSLLGNGVKFWGDEARVYLEDLIGDHLKVADQMESYRDAISDFEDSNNQLMNLKINEVMKTFTTLSFLTFPFMLLAAIFSMNTRDTPLINVPGAFWIVLGVMAVAMVTLFIYFKRKDWL